jgi:hypothetical protein
MYFKILELLIKVSTVFICLQILDDDGDDDDNICASSTITSIVSIVKYVKT